MILSYVCFKNYTCVITVYSASRLSHNKKFVETIFCHTIIVMKINLRFYRESFYQYRATKKQLKSRCHKLVSMTIEYLKCRADLNSKVDF